MKNVLLVILLSLVALFIAFGASAQGFSIPEKTSKSSTIVGEITIDGLTVKGGTSKTGNTFVMVTSQKSGKEYKRYLGINTGKTINFEGKARPVFVKNHKDGTSSYYMVYNNGGRISTKKVNKE